ncbi:hypothetical protein L570_1742 [Bordetella pertussis 2356847]|nr:hypothetical protein L570_1742 [Bordetella pertussis 2356847]
MDFVHQLSQMARFLKSGSDEPCIQPIESSQLEC